MTRSDIFALCHQYMYFIELLLIRLLLPIQCGLSSHKKCLETLHWECGGRDKQALARRMTTFGVDFSAHIQETHTDIPHLVKQCVAEIDKVGIDMKVRRA